MHGPIFNETLGRLTDYSAHHKMEDFTPLGFKKHRKAVCILNKLTLGLLLLSVLILIVLTAVTHIFRCGSRIWSRGGPQLLRPTVADVAKRSRASEASILRPGSRARLRALEAFGFLMLKYAFSHILDTLFLLFLTFILTPKVDKNRALDFTSINLRHSDMLHLFFNLHEKVML